MEERKARRPPALRANLAKKRVIERRDVKGFGGILRVLETH